MIRTQAAEIAERDPALVRDGLEWLRDAFPMEADSGDIADDCPSPADVILAVDRNFEGGLPAFLASR